MKIIYLMLFIVYNIYAGGFDFIDHKVNKDTSGIWSIGEEFPTYLGITIGIGALMEGEDSRLGKTLWKSMDSTLLTSLTTTGLKNIIGRDRPNEVNNPNSFNGGKSMPSAHTALTTSLLSPIIFEYSKDSYWYHTLWAIPIFEGVSRVKAQEHWQTDVLLGMGIGILSSYVVEELKGPWTVKLLPQKEGMYIGLNYQF